MSKRLLGDVLGAVFVALAVVGVYALFFAIEAPWK